MRGRGIDVDTGSLAWKLSRIAAYPMRRVRRLDRNGPVSEGVTGDSS